MKILRKILLILSLIFFLLAGILSAANAYKSYAVIIGNFGNNQILAVLSLCGMIFLLGFLFLKPVKPSVISLISACFIVFSAVIVSVITFSPSYYYTSYFDEETTRSVVVEEKLSPSCVSVWFYKEEKAPFYKSAFGAPIENEKAAQYTLGDYTIEFQDKTVRVCVPLYSKTHSLFNYSK